MKYSSPVNLLAILIQSTLISVTNDLQIFVPEAVVVLFMTHETEVPCVGSVLCM